MKLKTMKNSFLLIVFFLFVIVTRGNNLVCKNIKEVDQKCLDQTVFLNGPKEHIGDKGEKGDIGKNGTKGEIGEPGLNGTKGFNGSKGQKGETGETVALNMTIKSL